MAHLPGKLLARLYRTRDNRRKLSFESLHVELVVFATFGTNVSVCYASLCVRVCTGKLSSITVLLSSQFIGRGTCQLRHSDA